MPRLPRAAGTRLRLGLPNLNDQWRLAAVRPADKAGPGRNVGLSHSPRQSCHQGRAGKLRGHAHHAGREQTSRGVAGWDTNQE